MSVWLLLDRRYSLSHAIDTCSERSVLVKEVCHTREGFRDEALGRLSILYHRRHHLIA